ncbi:MAG TPA: VWA domain-containing protein [Vicinamibacterales bacterium]|nr:VWA domain-containing protein [Vicinamibacterales bacterium]
MRVLHPEMAVWLAALPVVIACWTLRYRYKWRQRRAWDPVSGSRRSRRMRDVASLALALLAVILLTGAMMRPQISAERQVVRYEQRTLVLLLDRSVSMQARDVPPTRAARALAEIEQFLRKKPASVDRIALVGFSATPVVLAYPTADVESLLFYLEWLREDTRVLFGTDMSAALETALSLTAPKDAGEPSPPMFVLISDGDDQSGRLEATAARVARAGIAVHTIGIGSDAAVTVPVMSEAGREELLKDDEGRVLRTTFTEGTLRRLAALTGGRYFRSATGGELAAALERVTAADRRPLGWTRRIEYRDLYLLFLAGAAAAVTGLVILA